jgi:cytochrome c biogenesis factor
MLEESVLRLGTVASVPAVAGDGWLEVAIATFLLSIAEAVRLYTRRNFREKDIDDDLVERIRERMLAADTDGKDEDQ